MAKSIKFIIDPETGRTKVQQDPERVEDIDHRRSTMDLSEPRLVRRVRIVKDQDGNIHLELEE